jgi:hypothetical protein
MFYYIPTRKDKKKHYDEFEEREKMPNYDQKLWEEQHLYSAQYR